MIPVYQQLLGISGHKPWECVGTNEEMTLSMYQTWIKTPELHQTPIMQLFADKIIPNLTPEVVDDLQHKLYHIETSDMIPTSLRDRIRQVIDQ